MVEIRLQPIGKLPNRCKSLTSGFAQRFHTDALEIGGSRGQSDLLAFLIPSSNHPWFGSSVEGLYASFGQNRKWHAYLGFAPLLLALLGMGARSSRWRSAPFGVALVIFWSFTLGEVLLIGGVRYDLPLPYELIGGLAPVQALRSPDRFNLMVCLLLPIMTAYGFAALVRRPSAVALGTAAGLLLIEYLPVPYSTTSAELHVARAALLSEPIRGAVLEIPLTRQAAKRTMYAQTLHGRPLVGGMVARTPEVARRYAQSSPLLRAFMARPVAVYRCDSFVLSQQWAQLESDGISHVVLNVYGLSPRMRDALISYFPVAPVAGKGYSHLYRVAELKARPIRCP